VINKATGIDVDLFRDDAEEMAAAIRAGEANADQATRYLKKLAEERGLLKAYGGFIIGEIIDDALGAIADAPALNGGSDQHDPLLLDPAAPLDNARAFIRMKYSTESGACILHHHADVFRAWSGTHYPELDAAAVRADAYRFLDAALCRKGKNTVPFKPTTSKVNQVLDALRAEANLPRTVTAPAWLKESDLDPLDIVACTNGLLHLPTRKLLNHTSAFFNLNALPFAYEPRARQPKEWFAFLRSVWEDDQEAIDALQEIFGYCLTLDQAHQKIFMLVGPRRCGKGTIGRTLTALLGRDNVTGPTLASIGTNFGLAPLIGKPLAIISDARLGSRADQQVIAERLLSISGEDGLTIDRKYLSAWTGRLPTRFLLLTNELPRITDASGALASRFIVLVMTKSFYGREDLGLERRLIADLPGILNWALDGRDRLAGRGYFVQPTSSIEVAQQLYDLSSPMGAFVRDRCIVDAPRRVGCDLLFEEWKAWCLAQGRDHPGTKQTFGRDLRAAVPTIRVTQPRNGEDRHRYYEGIGLKPIGT
jgi:putative DNA primase/helicase